MEITPIESLIKIRASELGLSYADLVRGAGYTNEAKGMRRLNSLLESDFESARGLLENLPRALNLPEDIIKTAVEETIRINDEHQESEWRKSFKPNVHILTEHNGRPRQITIAAVCNAGKYVNINFPETVNQDDYLVYVMSRLHKILDEAARYYYPPTGFVINWSPDRASRYDLHGSPVETLSRALV